MHDTVHEQGGCYAQMHTANCILHDSSNMPIPITISLQGMQYMPSCGLQEITVQ